MKHIIVFLSCSFFLLILSCNDKRNVIRDSDGNIVSIYKYMDMKDTTSYELTSYYPNNSIKKIGRVENSKQEGAWLENYSDGSYRRTTYYKDGIADVYEKKRNLPSIEFINGSLKVGEPTSVRAIDLYKSEMLGCVGGKILPSQNDDFDFIVIPDLKDSLSILYFDPLTSENDTIELKKSQKEEYSKYGLTQKDFKDKESIIIIKEIPKTRKLITVAVSD